MKPTWHEYFMSMVDLVATRSTCLRRQVGAILVKDNRVITTGYNGPPAGIKECTQETCIRTVQNIPSGERLDLCIAVHAEQNSIIQAAYIGVSVKDSWMYTGLLPCLQCTKMILNAGISNIVVRNPVYEGISLQLYKQRPEVSIWLYKDGDIHKVKHSG